MDKTEANNTLFIAQNLRLLISEKGINQEVVGNYCNVTNSCVSSWCRGLNLPPIDKIVIICKQFDISLDDFVTKKLKVERKLTA